MMNDNSQVEQFEVYKSAGDLQIALIFDDNPTMNGDHAVRFSKHGVKKSLKFESPDLEELENIFQELDEEVDISLIYECQQCGNRYEMRKPKSPYKCECGSRKFELVDGFDPIDKKTGNILISVYVDDDSLKLEIADKNKKTNAEIFEKMTEESFEKAKEVCENMVENLEAYNKEMRGR